MGLAGVTLQFTHTQETCTFRHAEIKTDNHAGAGAATATGPL